MQKDKQHSALDEQTLQTQAQNLLKITLLFHAVIRLAFSGIWQ